MPSAATTDVGKTAVPVGVREMPASLIGAKGRATPPVGVKRSTEVARVFIKTRKFMIMDNTNPAMRVGGQDARGQELNGRVKKDGMRTQRAAQQQDAKHDHGPRSTPQDPSPPDDDAIADEDLY
jgi:hypothetical protein